MRAITVQQPYAWAIATGAKDVENRVRSVPWRSAVGQRIAIHAGKAWYDGAEHDVRIVDLSERHTPAPLWPTATAAGAVVAVATLAQVHWAGACAAGLVHGQRSVDAEGKSAPSPSLCSTWAEPQAWHLVLDEVRALPHPVPARGFQGLWTLPDDVASAVAERVRDVS